MNALALYGRYVAASLRAQAQYPAATLLLTLGHAAATAIEILGVYALFERFGRVGGWSFGYLVAKPSPCGAGEIRRDRADPDRKEPG